MPDKSNELVHLELQLRLARNRLDAAESGLFAPLPAILALYRAEVARLEQMIRAIRH